MTIEEAIKHCEEVAEEQERKAQCMGRQFVGTAMANYQNGCFECAADHRQLAEWLKELKELRNSVGAVKLADMKAAQTILSKLSAADVQPVKRGKWELIDGQEKWIQGYTCSECGQVVVTYECNFCPNCGAYMRGNENDRSRKTED